MQTTPIKKTISRYFTIIFAAALFFSCQKELHFEGGSGGTQPDLTTKINSSVSGFVTDENEAPVLGASVQFGASTATTDKYGYFEFKNVQVVKEAAVVSVTKAGYFKGFRTFIATEGKAAFVRIKLILKSNVGSFNSTIGGTVILVSGFDIKFYAGTIVNAATNAQYNGTVNVSAFWLNPGASDINRIMPGDLRGTNKDGSLKILQTFGMGAVELTGSSGELLQIVNGQRATITMLIPGSLSASAPATIPLWYFNETNGLWKEEGTATRIGNAYVGDVSHFSYWNCDVPNNYVQFNCTLKNTAGNPIPYTLVKVSVAGTSNSGWGYTDSSGYTGGAVPNNANLILEVYTNWGCTTPIYTQPFTTTNVNISLGVITIATTNNVATLSGTVTNCANSPVTNGNIIVAEGPIFTKYPLSNTGAYSFSKIFCTFPQTVTLIGEDIANSQQSPNTSYVVNSGTNTVGNIQACGVTTQQFVNYTINGTSYSFTAPVDSIFMAPGNGNSFITIEGNRIGSPNNYASLFFDGQGIALNSSQPFSIFRSTELNQTPNPLPIFVNITEYGAIGEYISGNFTGTFIETLPPNTSYNVTCSFRVRRTF